MPKEANILIVEDDELLGKAFMVFLQETSCRLQHVVNGEDALALLRQSPPDILLLDLLLPDIHGQEILEFIQQQGLSVTTIVITTEASTDAAVRAMKAGATDYIVKPLNAERLQTTVHNTLERLNLQQRLQHYQSLFPEERFEGFVGVSPEMQLIYRIIDSAAQSRANVFITGESGTGKELCSEALHHRSDRKAGPFVAVNCAAIPRDLLESELFGHAKGAFTGATANRVGAAARADGGTLFFDEVCELDLDLQAKLLRFIQTRQFQPVGSSQLQSTDVRFVCASNRDPWKEVEAGRFREDLYYRLFVVPVAMPPLRERDGDILLLAKHFLELLSREHNKQFNGFSPSAERLLLSYQWPGNVRELQNVIHNAVVLGSGGLIHPGMFELLKDKVIEPMVDLPTLRVAGVESQSIRPLWQEEREVIERAIRLCDGNVADAARRLEISDSTIYRKRQKWLELQQEGGE